MLNLPSDLHRRYLAFLGQNGIPDREIGFFLKWLRYYLDFCLKYRFPQEEKSSLSRFLGKLREKRQTSAQVEQASRAIAYFYEFVSRGKPKEKKEIPTVLGGKTFSNGFRKKFSAKERHYPAVPDPSLVPAAPAHFRASKYTRDCDVQASKTTVKENSHLLNKGGVRLPSPRKVNSHGSSPAVGRGAPSANMFSNLPMKFIYPELLRWYDYSPIRDELVPTSINETFKSTTGASWVKEFQGMGNEIQVRHYSKKTANGNTFWLRKFQTFTKSKPPDLLSIGDVKEFLTFLAVKQQVAASTQNQAFNALLFFSDTFWERNSGGLTGL